MNIVAWIVGAAIVAAIVLVVWVVIAASGG